MRPTAGDITILALVALAIAGFTWQVWTPTTAAAWAEVRCADQEPQRYPLDHAQQLDVLCRIGVSHIAIEPGRARFVSSPCTTKVCVHAGWLSRSGDAAACLPNAVSLRLGGQGAAIDAVSQ